DQFRGDYLERYRDQFGEGGFRLLLDRGANFTDCNFDYANTHTAAGHATLLTGAYSNGHGIHANSWWDRQTKRMVTSVQDDGTRVYGSVSATPFANDYEFELPRELITYEQLGSRPVTDLLTIGLSANDILGHQVGPDSPEMQAMALATDRQLADFFDFLGHQVGLANLWIALSADHGIAPLASVTKGFRIPAPIVSPGKLRAQVNQLLSKQLSPGRSAE